MARLEADERRAARDGCDQRIPHHAPRPRNSRLGRRAAGALLGRPRAAAASRVVGRCRRRGETLDATVLLAALVGDQQSALFGQGMLRARRGEGDLWDGELRAGERRFHEVPRRPGLLEDRGRGRPWRGAAGCRGGRGARQRCCAAVAQRRSRHPRLRVRERAPRAQRRVERRRRLRPRADRARLPHWNPDVRGAITGITRGTTRGHLVRATLEAIAHQVVDVLEVLPLRVDVLRADGERARTASHAAPGGSERLPCRGRRRDGDHGLGAAALAGLAVGLWRDLDEVGALIRRGARYEPGGRRNVAELRDAWRHALRQATVP